MLSLLKDWTSAGLPPELAARPGVLHSFSAGWEDAAVALEHGFYLGFTGPLTYKKSDEMRSVAEKAPLDRVVVETDAPYLAPHPKRGQRNEPAFVRHTAEKLAQVRNVDLDVVCEQTTANACRLFALPVDVQAQPLPHHGSSPRSHPD
jgi:TatD DNase family protein